MGEYFLEIDGVKGESMAALGGAKIKLESWSYSLSSPSDVLTHAATGTVQFSDLEFTKTIDIATPALINACTSNRNFTKARLLCRKAGGDQFVFYTVEMENARISSIIAKGPDGASAEPKEVIRLSFQKVRWEYAAQKDSSGRLGGKTSAQYSVARNE